MSKPKLFNIDHSKADNRISEVFVYSVSNPDSREVIKRVSTDCLEEAGIEFSIFKGVTSEKVEEFKRDLGPRFPVSLGMKK